MKAAAITTSESGEPVESTIEINHASLSFNVGYTDVTDKANPKSGNFSDNANLNFQNEAELNRVLTEKPYLLKTIPHLVQQIITGYDPENKAAKEFKTAVESALKEKQAK